MTHADDYLLDIQNLTLRFGSQEAVRQVNWRVPAGRALGVVGESGSGKSVTTLSVLGLLPASGVVSGGAIWFQSPRLGRINLLDSTLSAKQRERQWQQVRGREIGLVFQEPMSALNPLMRVGEQVAELLRLHLGHTPKQALRASLERFEEVQLPDPERLAKRYPHELSGGQKQRVMIAMAIACQPALLLADEPTTALDVTVQRRVLDLLQELQARYAMSLVFISHDLGVVAEIADEVVVMRRGQVLETAPTLKLFEAPTHPYTKGLLACRPPLEQRLERLPTVPELEANPQAPLPRVVPEEAIAERLTALSAAPVLVQAVQLSKVFARRGQRTVAVEAVSLEVRRGETLGIVGESGSGKTTLGRCLLQLTPCTSGSVFWDGQAVQDLSSKALRSARKRFQVVFQDPFSALNPRLRIGQALLEPLQVHGIGASKSERLERIRQLLHRLDLPPDSLERYPDAFSGGQRQRICIARALTVNPEFIVLDESVSALDVSVQAQILNLLKDLQNELGLTYLFISHDVSVMNHLADRVLVMQAGRVVEQGPTHRVLQTPQEAYTQQLIAAIPRGRLQDIEDARQKRQVRRAASAAS